MIKEHLTHSNILDTPKSYPNSYILAIKKKKL